MNPSEVDWEICFNTLYIFEVYDCCFGWCVYVYVFHSSILFIVYVLNSLCSGLLCLCFSILCFHTIDYINFIVLTCLFKYILYSCG